MINVCLADGPAMVMCVENLVCEVQLVLSAFAPLLEVRAPPPRSTHSKRSSPQHTRQRTVNRVTHCKRSSSQRTLPHGETHRPPPSPLEARAPCGSIARGVGDTLAAALVMLFRLPNVLRPGLFSPAAEACSAAALSRPRPVEP